MNTRARTCFILSLIATFLRFAPHPDNFTPLFAVTLFAGRMLKNTSFPWG